MESIAAEYNKLLKQDFVRFKIKMWDAGIRSKVLGRLRSLPSLMNIEIQEEDVNVVPYKEVQLVVNSGTILKSIRLADCPTSYHKLNESIQFHFKCDHPSEAEELAENLKKGPQLIVAEWKFSLECRDFPGRPNCSFKVNTLACDYAESNAIVPGFVHPLETILLRQSGYENEIKELKVMIQSANDLSNEAYSEIRDLQGQMETMRNKNFVTAVPVFSVRDCINPDESFHSYRFSTSVIDTNTDHGNFDLPSGIFTVKTAGNYLINFNTHVDLDQQDEDRWAHRMHLKVNGETEVSSNNYSSTGGIQSVVMTALLTLKTGDKVGIFGFLGELWEVEVYHTRFFGILLFDRSRE